MAGLSLEGSFEEKSAALSGFYRVRNHLQED
jgi:hypothetical protein